MKNKRKKKIVILTVSILLVLILIVGLTYAFFQVGFTGNGNIIKIADGISLELKNEATLSLTDVMPMTDAYALENIESYDFDLVSTGSRFYEYTIGIEHLKTDLPVSELRYSIKKGNDKWTTPEDLSNFNYESIIAPNQTLNFQLKIWVRKEATKDYQNIEYEGRIGVVASELSDTTKLIKVDLEDGMIPIKWNGTAWVKADAANTNKDWYDYNNQQWANMALVTGGSRATLQNASVGTEVAMNNIEAMYVYIPRYRYKLWNAENGSSDEQEIRIEFETKEIEKANGTTNGTWLTHPAFTFGNDELNGIWVGKFETSAAQNSTCYTSPSAANCNVTTISPKIVPNVDSWRFAKVSTFFTGSQKFKNYGLISTNVDSHMMKNMEWGAVAYLSHSKYGKYGNSSYDEANKEIYVNNYNSNNSNNSTKKTRTGCSAGRPGEGSSALTNVSTSCEYTYEKDETGTGASTTGTIYGVYDMSGGAEEYVMGNMVDSSGNFYPSLSGFTSAPASKYYDSYAYSTDYKTHERGKLGDATKETLKTFGNGLGGWYGDIVSLPYSGASWFVRGGSAYNGYSVGIFFFDDENGNPYYNTSFRGVLADVGA